MLLRTGPATSITLHGWDAPVNVEWHRQYPCHGPPFRLPLLMRCGYSVSESLDIVMFTSHGKPRAGAPVCAECLNSPVRLVP